MRHETFTGARTTAIPRKHSEFKRTRSQSLPTEPILPKHRHRDQLDDLIEFEGKTYHRYYDGERFVLKEATPKKKNYAMVELPVEDPTVIFNKMQQDLRMNQFNMMQRDYMQENFRMQIKNPTHRHHAKKEVPSKPEVKRDFRKVYTTKDGEKFFVVEPEKEELPNKSKVYTTKDGEKFFVVKEKKKDQGKPHTHKQNNYMEESLETLGYVDEEFSKKEVVKKNSEGKVEESWESLLASKEEHSEADPDFQFFDSETDEEKTTHKLLKKRQELVSRELFAPKAQLNSYPSSPATTMSGGLNDRESDYSPNTGTNNPEPKMETSTTAFYNVDLFADSNNASSLDFEDNSGKSLVPIHAVAPTLKDEVRLLTHAVRNEKEGKERLESENMELRKQISILKKRMLKDLGKSQPYMSKVPTSVQANLNLKNQFKQRIDAERERYAALQDTNKKLAAQIKKLEFDCKK